MSDPDTKQLHEAVDSYNDACRKLQARGLFVDVKMLNVQTLNEHYARDHMSVAVFERIDL